MLFEMGSIEVYAGPFHVEQLRKNDRGVRSRVQDDLAQKIVFDEKLWSVAKCSKQRAQDLLWNLYPDVGAAARWAGIPSVLPAVAWPPPKYCMSNSPAPGKPMQNQSLHLQTNASYLF